MGLVITTSHSPHRTLITSVGVFEQGLCAFPSWKTPLKLNIRGFHNQDSYCWDQDCDRDCSKYPPPRPGLGLCKEPSDSWPLLEKSARPSCRQYGAQQRRERRQVCPLPEVARGEERFFPRTAGRKGLGAYLLFGSLL